MALNCTDTLQPKKKGASIHGKGFFTTTYSLVSEMLEKAFGRLIEEDTLLMHSDQGWHYQMKPYRHALKKRGITQSMSRKGNCYDNSVMENFLGIMKSEAF